MRDQKLKRRLAALPVPQYDSGELEDTIIKAKQIRFRPEKQRMKTMQFFRNQIRFIRKEFWGMKFIFTALLQYCILSEGMESDGWLWTFVSISGPVLCLVNANVLCDVYQPGMLELQMTAKHSLQKVLILRLIVSGTVDLLAFVCSAVMLILWKGVYLWQIFLYAMVPYNLMCVGCLAILNRKTEENALPYCMTWGIVIVFVMTLLKTGGYQIFGIENVTVWVVLGALSVLGVMREMKRLIQVSACKVVYEN